MAQITLFRDCLITPEKNLKVDDLEQYLGTLSVRTWSDTQLIKHDLEITVKVNLGQDYLEYQDIYRLNYASICNNVEQDFKTVYYFVVDRKWISKNGLQLSLRMDTVNTFLDDSSLELSDKTKILRQHKDRYEIKTVSGQRGRYRKIDLYSEGITPVLYGEEKRELREPIDLNWYLVYRNQNDPSESQTNPVNCFLVTDNDLNIANYDFDFFDGSIPISTLKTYLRTHTPSGEEYSLYFIGYCNKGATFNGVTMSGNDFIEIYPGANDHLWEKYDDGHGNVYYQEYENESLSIGISMGSTIQIGSSQNSSYTARSYADANLFGNSGQPVTITGLNHLDRTDPKIIKIIKLPYCPVSYEIAQFSGVLDPTKDRVLFDRSVWNFPLEQPAYRWLKLVDLNTKFERTIDFYEQGQYNPFEPLRGTSVIPQPNITDEKSADNESKLYHSDYYLPKVIYDSFSLGFQLERVTTQFSQLAPRFRTDYLCTSTINSRFSFSFPDYYCSPYNVQDYNNVMVVARNNEMPIYNQQYINYLRAGYNYDVKSKQKTEATTWIGAGLQLVGAVGAFASSVYTGGFGVAAGAALTTSAIASITNAISTTVSAEQSFNQKQEQLKQQATSVYSSDDVDIMSGYAKNRAKVMLYKVSPKMRELLFDLFFYTGYISNEIGVPNTTSRCRFNFVSCEPVFVQTPNLTKPLVEDIIDKYKAGVTFLHHFNNEWDFEQQYENWETSLIS